MSHKPPFTSVGEASKGAIWVCERCHRPHVVTPELPQPMCPPTLSATQCRCGGWLRRHDWDGAKFAPEEKPVEVIRGGGAPNDPPGEPGPAAVLYLCLDCGEVSRGDNPRATMAGPDGTWRHAKCFGLSGYDPKRGRTAVYHRSPKPGEALWIGNVKYVPEEKP